MKKLLILLLAAVMLGACGTTTHENISKNMATDTRQVLDILDVAVEKSGKVDKKDEQILEAYLDRYESKSESELLNKEELLLFDSTKQFIIIKGEYTDLKSDQEQYKVGRQNIVNIIETGEGY